MSFIILYSMALFVTYLLYKFLNKLLLKSFPKHTNRALITFGIASVIVLLVFSFILSILYTIIFYIPCLFFWLVNDIMKARLQKKYPK